MYPDYLIYIFIAIMCTWTFWPIFDFVQVWSGKLPPVKSSSIEAIKEIKSKGFLYRYSALKRYKKLPEAKRLGKKELMQNFSSL